LAHSIAWSTWDENKRDLLIFKKKDRRFNGWRILGEFGGTVEGKVKLK